VSRPVPVADRAASSEPAAIAGATELPGDGVASGSALTSGSALASGGAVVSKAVSRPAAPRATRLGSIARAYLALTKPRIVELLLVTTVPAMILARTRLPGLALTAAVLTGGALAAGAANALNCYLDRDIDEVMRRTRRRPLPAHVVSPRSALLFGLSLAVVATATMAVFTNWLATGLTVAAIGYYDLIYTRWLKRRTSQNTFWGGVCGAMPVLIGWAAVTHTLSVRSWLLFAVVFFWQMPHFYALAVKFKDDYARAGVPMLPVVATSARVGGEIVVFSWLTFGASLGLWLAGMTPVYGAAALVLGIILVAQAHGLAGRLRAGSAPAPMRLFHWSTAYLTLLFAAVAIDALIQ
jgi:protoheme IX farnesyltransferase